MMRILSKPRSYKCKRELLINVLLITPLPVLLSTQDTLSITVGELPTPSPSFPLSKDNSNRVFTVSIHPQFGVRYVTDTEVTQM